LDVYLFSNGQSLRGRLSKIRSPTLLIWGENDQMTPPYDQYLQEYNEIPNTFIHKMNHCGHTPFVEKPIRSNASLLKFVTGKELYSVLSRQMNDDAREREKTCTRVKNVVNVLSVDV